MTEPYAGIGSRETPDATMVEMRRIGRHLAEAGWLLRSGGATGADSAFERGCDDVRGPREIFLAGFHEHTTEAVDLAARIHPAWYRLSPYSKLLHIRNCMIVLGAKLDAPVKFVICWTKGGEAIGGTRTAIVLAGERGIPVINLATEPDWRAAIARVVGRVPAP